MRHLHKLAAATIISVAVLGLSACWEDASDGSAEKLGEHIDEAASDVKRALEDAAD